MDFQKELEKINISYAIETKPESNLIEILRSLDPEDLLLTASQWGIKDGFIIKKERIIKRLLEFILNRRRIEEILVCTRSGGYDLFLNLIDRDYIQDNTLPYGTYGYLMDKGIIYSFYDKGRIFFNIPDEIKKVFKDIDKIQLDKIIKRYQLVYEYIMAFINLYGVFRKDMLVEIFNSQNDEEISLEEFEMIFNKHLMRQQPFYEYDEYVINHYFDDENLIEMEILLEKTTDLPYYIPDSKNILKYADGSYLETTPQMKALKDFIIDNMRVNEELAGYLVDDIEVVCSLEDTMQDIVYEFERRGIFFESMEQLNSLIPFVEDMYRNVRIWPNGGHTYAEIYKMTGRPAPKMCNEPVEVMINNKAIMQKVGRNDLCPCGSGKKYKKCCSI